MSVQLLYEIRFSDFFMTVWLDLVAIFMLLSSPTNWILKCFHSGMCSISPQPSAFNDFPHTQNSHWHNTYLYISNDNTFAQVHLMKCNWSRGNFLSRSEYYLPKPLFVSFLFCLNAIFAIEFQAATGFPRKSCAIWEKSSETITFSWEAKTVFIVVVSVKSSNLNWFGLNWIVYSQTQWENNFDKRYR